jgi:V/A-type H+/Na+-transporting ATPase subunit D
MAPQLIRVRPTKIELIKLRKRLVLASRIQKIVKDRLSILIMEFLEVSRETVEAKKEMLAQLAEAYRTLSVASGYHGYIALDREIAVSQRNIGLVTGSRNIAGVRIPSVELSLEKTPGRGYSLTDTSSWVDRSTDQFEKALLAIANLAEYESSLEMLGREIRRTKRIVNALEHLVIPSLEVTIEFLAMKFEERDREEKARLKRVKTLLEQKK